MRVLAVLLFGAWLAYTYTGAGHVSAPVVSKSLQSSNLEDCHCLIPPNHGLYR